MLGKQWETNGKRPGIRFELLTAATQQMDEQPTMPSLLARSLWVLSLWVLSLGWLGTGTARGDEPAIIAPREIIRPFNGKDLDGFIPWIRETGHDDPEGEYRVTDGTIHLAGRRFGYLATKDAYRDYHLKIEYRWGDRTDGSKYVRNSGILLHATGPHGNARGVWMASIECQLAQGCEGDLIVIRGETADGETIPVTLTSNTRTASDGRTRFDPDGMPTRYSGKQFWWSKHEPGFRELLDTRGRDDVASPLGEWTLVECLCRGDRITIKINGEIVNECYDVFPSAGRILLENEGNEIYFRNFEIHPLKPTAPPPAP